MNPIAELGESPERRPSLSSDGPCPQNNTIEISMGENDLNLEREMRAHKRPARTTGNPMVEIDSKKEYKDEGWWRKVDQLAKVWQHDYALEAIDWAIKIGKGIDREYNKETNLEWKMIQCEGRVIKAVENGDEGAFHQAVEMFCMYVGCVMATMLERRGIQLDDMAIMADSRKARLTRLIYGWCAWKESISVDRELKEVTKIKKRWENVMEMHMGLDVEEMSSQGSRWIEEVEKELNPTGGNSA
ncbi:hypothetical protein B7494_g8109 [Chlorociboria aeruginascens]|nr:hypothetical protein B7494_g8109 [Chlorociboria aeruginascens]